MSDPAQPPKKRGCFFYGCLTLVILVLAGALATYLGVRYVANKVTQLVNNYTDTAPIQLDTVTLPPAQMSVLRDRVAAFGQALQNPSTPQELVLTAEEINALIGGDPSYKAFKGQLLVQIPGDQIKGKLSLPLQDIGPLKLKGRYLNGEASLRASLVNGELDVHLDSVIVKGQPLPAAVMTELKKNNLAAEFQKDPKNTANLEKFDNIQIKDGKLILRTKGRP